MRYNPTDRIGVNATERIILSDFKWIFREQAIVDVGIDALIEQSENGNPTGKFIAFQIKSGKGNFHIAEKKITYYISNIHYNYWLNFDIPVILIAHIPETNETYWEEISEQNIKKATKRWKLEIPIKNKLNLKAKPKLTKLLSNNKTEYGSIKIFQGKDIDEETIYDLVAKSDCISDANESTTKTVQFLLELTEKINESNEKFEQYNLAEKSFKSPQVIASVKSFSKDLNIYSKRLENECQIFSETIGEGIFAFEQAILIHYLLTKDVINITNSLESVVGLPQAIDYAIRGIEIMRNGVNGLPENYSSLKTAKNTMLSVIDLMIDEYFTAKSMILNLIDKVETEIKTTANNV